MPPRVSVVMAVYNGERYLREAVDSLLAQTLRDFELIAVDDGSTDATGEILSSYAAADPRVQIVDAPHAGLPGALNAGWRQAAGEYIARMDADDIALPERLARQVAFLDSHPEVGLCSTGFRTIGARKNYTRTQPGRDDDIRCSLLFQATLVHSALMVRRNLLAQVDGYDPAWLHAEDYDLFVRLSTIARLASLPEVLMLIRMYPESVSRRYADEQAALSAKIHQAQLARLGVDMSDAALAIHERLSTQQFGPDREFLPAAEAWLARLRQANQTAQLYPETAFSALLARRWYAACRAAAGLGPIALIQFVRSPLARAAGLNVSEWLEFGTACLKTLVQKQAP